MACYHKGREGLLPEAFLLLLLNHVGVNLSLWTDLGHSTSAGGSASFRSSRADTLHGRI